MEMLLKALAAGATYFVVSEVVHSSIKENNEQENVVAEDKLSATATKNTSRVAGLAAALVVYKFL